MEKILIYGGTSLIAKELIKILDSAENQFLIFCRNKQNFENYLKENNLEKEKFSIYEVNLENLEENIKIIDSISDIKELYWIAGFTGDPKKEILDLSTCQKNINVNFLHPIIIMNKIISNSKIKINGSIAVVTSVAGLRGRAKNIFYGSAKSALISYLSGIRQKYDGKINVTTIIPGYIKTSKFSMKAPNFLIIEPSALAKKIVEGVRKKKEVIYSSIIWRVIMLCINLIPEKIFKKLKF